MKILFVYSFMWSYVKKDFDILSSVHCVRECHFKGLKDVPDILRGVKWCDVTFSWFGKLHAFFTVLFSKILGKKSIVVAGGDDVAHEPQIKYGMFSYWWKKWCPLFVFKYADLIFSVSESNRKEAIQNAKVDQEKVKLIYHGFDVQKRQIIDGIRKEKLVLTVGRITDETFLKKGLELFVRSASHHESFGCSLAEAMLCECVPVVSQRTAIPEVVGDCGFYVDELTPEAVSVAIRKALDCDLGKNARRRIEKLFPLEKRRSELLKALDKLS